MSDEGLDPPNLMWDAEFFDVNAKCAEGHEHRFMAVRFHFDPDDEQDVDDVLIPHSLIRPFITGMFDALAVMEEGSALPNGESSG